MPEMQASPTIDRVRGAIDGTPGFTRRQSAIKEILPIVGTTSTMVIETVRTDAGWHGFVEAMTPEGQVRLFLPDKAMRALYAHRDSIVKKAKSNRAKAAALTRREKAIRKAAEDAEAGKRE